jgi:ribose-phosphate pyrophosphokinase
MDKLKVFTGTAHPVLAQRICETLGVTLGRATVSRFPDGEVRVKVLDDVRGTDAYVVQPTNAPGDNLMELLLLVDCLRRASAERVTAVVPYFGYARQDRKDEGRVPISAKLVANLIAEAGAGRMLTIDLHAAQVQGFFDIPVDHLYAAPVLVAHFQSLGLANLVTACSDVGGVRMAREYGRRLGAGLAIVDKRRMGPGECEAVHLIGEVAGKTVLLTDDIIATASSVAEAARILRSAGAGDIYLAATHGVLCDDAIAKLREARIKQVVVTDTLPLPPETGEEPFRVLTVAGLLGEAIRRIHFHLSVSELFGPRADSSSGRES